MINRYLHTDLPHLVVPFSISILIGRMSKEAEILYKMELRKVKKMSQDSKDRAEIIHKAFEALINVE